MDYRLELVTVPVSDIDRAKAFYTEKAGFNADHDHRVSDEVRFVQLTPPGSPCSIAIGSGLGAEMAPGAVQGLQLVVADAEAARADLASRGVEVSDVHDFPWGRFVFFKDPDGNGWNIQEVRREG
ncbi:VOC family protein [Actinomadura sp.]|jgi:catechol 2,3-dioxygenase-like lactoylglutathione lyase family enzyme|uniref:VOC family protein n=1 Tax=Actinomadura sp. TaxID=1989 RepID=UPI0037C6D4B9